MKLKFYLTTLALGASFLAGAQTAPRNFPKTSETATAPVPGPPSEKTAGVGFRPLAVCQHNSNGSALMPVDSQSYSYPRASTLLNDATIRYSYSGGVWTAAYKDVFHYNALGQLDGYETLRWASWNNTWSTYQRGLYTLNSDGYPLEIIVQEWNSTTSSWFNVERHAYVRDAANYPTQYLSQKWDYTYTRWTPVGRYSYAYNAKHAYTTYTQEAFLEYYGTWLPQQRLDYLYDATDTGLVTLIQYAWATNLQTWATAFRTYYTNDPVSNKPVSSETKGIGSNGMEMNYQRATISYNAAGLKTQETTERWYTDNTFKNTFQQQISYNSAGLPTTEDLRYNDNGTWTYANVYAYRKNTYYENYTTSVAGGAAAGGELRVSPVPASSYVDISLSVTEPQDITILVTDMSGRIVSRVSKAAQQDVAVSLSVGSIPAGNYIVSVRGAKGASQARMITIAR